ncbi:MAG: glycoside hydrolase family 127 protein, partial [Fimbriimonadales bacterium]|nr:glycoside hydrolase family 127 protein [Fimbriimonadales bacterium]
MSFSRRFRNLPPKAIRVTDPFWSRWQEILCRRTVPHIHRQLVETGRIANFERAASRSGRFEGLFFNDSDVYKWLEAAAYAQAIRFEPSTQEAIDDTVRKIAAAQQADGYLNTFIQLEHPDLRYRNLGALHELYCIGHLVEAACALAENLGQTALLDVAVRAVGNVRSVFGPDGRIGYCGHEELENALVRLADLTGEESYRAYALWMIEQRGRRPSPFEAELWDEAAMAVNDHPRHALLRNGEYSGEYCQDHLPIRQHTEVVGHAVRAMYLYAAATQAAMDLGDEALEAALVRVWRNLVDKRMYITAGVGASASNEGFTRDYDLPNLQAYAETCAAIGFVLWSQRLLEATGESEFADVVELGLYNGVLSGIGTDGESFFYPNPLESRGQHRRVPWFACACCPPNVARTIGQIGSLAVGASDEAVWIHLPIGFDAELRFPDGPARLSARGEHPWKEGYELSIDVDRPTEFEVRVRIPGWADDVSFETSDDGEAAEYECGDAVFRRVWKPGDRIRMAWTLHPVWMESHPLVLENAGRVALQRGPVVYCLEEADLGAHPQNFSADVWTEPEAVSAADLFPGAVG